MKEYDLLQRLGRENLRQIGETVTRYGIDCDWEPTGTLNVATEPHQSAWLVKKAEHHDGDDLVFFDHDAIQQEISSPTYRAGLWNKTDSVMLHPAKLAWGLARVCRELGVEIFEGTHVRGLRKKGVNVVVSTEGGDVTASRVALATNVFPSLLARMRLFTVPVYDHAIMTEPLDGEQLEAIGWKHRQGLSDLNNRFHYYRLSADNRILFGGYDALYHFGRSMKPENEHEPATYRKLAAHFYVTFPQLKGVRFTHCWGGAIDTCSRFFSFFTLTYGGQVAFSAGYTGLGVGATRFGANVMLDLLAGLKTERTSLKMVRRLPLPFPPEPIAWLGVKLTMAAMVRQDRNHGREGLWLKFTHAIGMGFDS